MANPVSWIIDKVKRVNEVIWHPPKSDERKWQSFIFRQLKIIALTSRGFANDKVQLRASALTMYSLLSLVPLIAIAFATAKGFGLDRNLEQAIIQNTNFQPQVTEWLLTNARKALENTRGGYIAGVGVLILFWSVVSLLQNIENSFNHIWQVRQARFWYRKFTDYFTFLLIAPVFIILSSSLTVFVKTELTTFMSDARILAYFKPLVSFLFKFAPYFLFWISMTVLFIVMPNTKVRFVPAVISGIISGTILHILQWVYFELQFGITSLNAIYGSFAAVPLFIVWLQASWIIVLLGAELTFAYQNLNKYEQQIESQRISYFQKKALVLMIMRKVVRNFSTGVKPQTAESIATDLNIPVRLTREILLDLNSIGLISIVNEEESDQFFQPAMDINLLSISFIFTRLDKKGPNPVNLSENAEYRKVTELIDKFDKLIATSEKNILVKDL
jgi:membrane protein